MEQLVHLRPYRDYRDPEQFWDARWEELWDAARVRLAQVKLGVCESSLPSGSPRIPAGQRPGPSGLRYQDWEELLDRFPALPTRR